MVRLGRGGLYVRWEPTQIEPLRMDLQDRMESPLNFGLSLASWRLIPFTAPAD